MVNLGRQPVTGVSVDSDRAIDLGRASAGEVSRPSNDLEVISFKIDGAGSAITTGIKGDYELPFGGTIVAVRMLADQTGSIVVDIWKDTYANFPPLDGDSITASAVPTISSGISYEDTDLVGWTRAFQRGDILRFNVDSIATVITCTVSLTVRRQQQRPFTSAV